MEVKTLQIFKLPIWLKIHYSFVTIMSILEVILSALQLLVLDCTQLIQPYFLFVWLEIGVSEASPSHCSLAHVHDTAAVSWREGTAQQSWKYTFLWWWKSSVSALGLLEYHLRSLFFPTTSREEFFLNDKSAATKWISHVVKKSAYLQELLWLRLGNYFSSH